MKILYDHQIFTLQKYGGISRYFIELYSHLAKTGGVTSKISVMYSENIYFQTYFHQRSLLPKRKFPGKYRLINKMNEYSSKSQIEKGRFDIFHPTYYNPYFVKIIKKKPFVLTVHDMIHELYPQIFSAEDLTVVHKKELIEKASKIIAVSENTKKDILKFNQIDPKIISVIPHGSSLNDIASKKIPNLPKIFLLFVGNRENYKNYIRFIEAIAPILTSSDNSPYVICVGGNNFSNNEMALHAKLNIQNRILHCFGDDSTLKYLYMNAKALVFPSCYEGFGIPIIEAFNCGCPVVCSERSSFPEIAHDAAVYFNPDSKDSIKQSVQNILNDDSMRRSLIEKGAKRGRQFSWQKTAEQTKKVYEDILNETS